MERQIEELIRLLNQGVKHLPDTLNVLVQQFVLQKWVWAIFELVMMAVFASAMIITLMVMHRLPKIEEDYYNDTIWGRSYNKVVTCICIAAVSGVVAFIFAISATGNIAEAVSPVYSLINSLR
ncbi:hypothetical protein [Schleiferilactobacillus harbinensis]|uniref:hypothetical protein n=1 Tax=Schleiferilactobacillus harbinensis TaxID=304207 RepID=UPI00345E9419